VVIRTIKDDKFGNLHNPDNQKVTNNSCPDLVGDTLTPKGTLTASVFCEFTAVLEFVEPGDHVNEVTVKATDIQGNEASASESETVTVFQRGGGGAGGAQPPTDMLAPTDSLSAVTGGGSPLDGATSWAVWALLTAMLIVSGAWVVRRQRLAEI
jgi:hypothetical protein